MATDPDAAGKAALGVAYGYDPTITSLAIDTPRAVLIDTINKLSSRVNSLIGNTTADAVVSGGWQKTNDGKTTRYTRSFTKAAGNIGPHARVSAGTFTLPDSLTPADVRIFTSWDGGYSGHQSTGVEVTSGSSYVVNVGNTYTETLSYGGKVNVLIEKIN